MGAASGGCTIVVFVASPSVAPSTATAIVAGSGIPRSTATCAPGSADWQGQIGRGLRARCLRFTARFPSPGPTASDAPSTGPGPEQPGHVFVLVTASVPSRFRPADGGLVARLVSKCQ